MLNEIYNNQKTISQKSIEALKRDFIGIRSGKVSVSILDNIRVDYYGNLTPLNQVASVLATDAVTINITPWEKPMLKAIERAKVSIRNIRKDTKDEVKKLEKDKIISEDEAKKAYDEVQKITDDFIAKIDEAVKSKETELLKVWFFNKSIFAPTGVFSIISLMKLRFYRCKKI